MDALRSSIRDERKWDAEILKVKWGLNNTINKATNESPSELLLGYRPRNKSEVGLLNRVSERTYNPNVKARRDKVADVIKKKQAQMKKRYDLRKAPAKVFRCGEVVGIRRTAANNDGKSKQLLGNYGGPYEIKKVLGNDRYLVGDIKGIRLSQKPYIGVFPSGSLKAGIDWDVSSEGSSASDGEIS